MATASYLYVYNPFLQNLDAVVDLSSEVIGPASSTDNAVVVFDGATGKIIKNSTIITSVTGDISFGSGDATATPVAGSLRQANATGADKTGVNFVIKAGNGTGTGGSGSFSVQIANVAASSSTANTLNSVFFIQKDATFGTLARFVDKDGGNADGCELQIGAGAGSAAFPRSYILGGQDATDTNWNVRFAHKDSSSATTIPVGFQISSNKDINYTNAKTLQLFQSGTAAILTTNSGSNSDGTTLQITTKGSANTLGLFMDTVTNNMKVGISMDSPTAQLHVVSQATGLIGMKVDTQASPTVDVAQWLVNGTKVMSITKDGKVGIGNFTPAPLFGNTATNPGDYVGYGVDLTNGLIWTGSSAGYELAFSQTGSGTARNGMLVQTASTALDSVVFCAGSTTVGYFVIRSDGHLGMGVTAANYTDITSTMTIIQRVAPVASTPSAFTLTSAAHLAMAATVEASSVAWDFSASKQWATGAIATQREFRIIPPTYTAVGASVISSAALLSVSGPPTAGTNVTITTPTALLVSPISTQVSASGLNASGSRFLAGTMTVTGTTQVTSTCGASQLRLEALTVTNTSAGLIMDNAAALFIAAAPAQAGNLTITKTYAILSTGNCSFNGIVNIPTPASNKFIVGGTATLNNSVGLFISDSAGYEPLSIQNTLVSGFAQLDMYDNAAAQVGGFGYANASAAVQAGKAYFYTVAKDFHISTDSNTTRNFIVALTTGAITASTKATAGGVASFTITPGAHTAVTAAVVTGLTHTASTMTITGGYVAQSFNFIGQQTITAASTLTVTNAFGLSVTPPTVTASAVITGTNGIGIGSAVTGTTIANTAASTFSHLNTSTQTITLSAATQVTSACMAAAGRFGVITINQSGGAVVVDASSTVYIAGAVAAGASVTLTSAYALWVDAGTTRLDGRLNAALGANIAAANDLTLGSDGSTFTITGNTTINGIATAGWLSGAEINLIFTGTPTVKNNTAASAGFARMFLSGSADLSAAANTLLKLVYDGTQWQEIARKVA